MSKRWLRGWGTSHVKLGWANSLWKDRELPETTRLFRVSPEVCLTSRGGSEGNTKWIKLSRELQGRPTQSIKGDTTGVWTLGPGHRETVNNWQSKLSYSTDKGSQQPGQELSKWLPLKGRPSPRRKEIGPWDGFQNGTRPRWGEGNTYDDQGTRGQLGSGIRSLGLRHGSHDGTWGSIQTSGKHSTCPQDSTWQTSKMFSWEVSRA